ncbi:interleukin-27 subunit alpha [Eucyclogobius newberryi]|uniref:interleukin-27 subunit alpha n=1 Tax=Eucyclogobius newberryi TaxID=166745 RepID=UPI003B58C7E9
MTLWGQVLILLCFSLSCVHCLPSAVLHTKYITSYRLARFTRCRVQQLLMRYKEEQLEGKDYVDRSQHLKDLPSLSTDFYSWLKLTDEERLGAALSDMQAFRSMLDWKREQLSYAETQSTLPGSFQHIGCDLRDLIRQVNNQKNYIGSTERPRTTRGPGGIVRSSSRTQWDSRVEGYIILRDLDLYLIKLARDFLLLANKTTPTQRNRK